MILVGCDPGASGGFAWNEPKKGVQACGIPDSEAETVALIRRIVRAGIEDSRDLSRCHVFIEQVGGYMKPQDDDEERENRQPGHTMFQFGRGVGVIFGAFLSLGVLPVEVHPRTWQKPFFIPRGSKEDRKRAMKAAAQRRFPQLKVTLKTADALLIRAYGEISVEANPRAPLAGIQSGKPEKQADKAGKQFKRQFRKEFAGLKAAVKNVSRPVGGKTVELSREEIMAAYGGNPSQAVLDSLEPPKLEIHSWEGQPAVFDVRPNGSMVFVRIASPLDCDALGGS